MELPVRIETRTGDTPASRRQRQRRDPPDILLTTPEQIALLLASADAPHLFKHLRRIVLDELHALAGSKRGDLLSLGLARLRALAPEVQTVGLSATVADPDTPRRWLVPQSGDVGWAIWRWATSSSPRPARRRIFPCSTPRGICPGPGTARCMRCDEVYQLIKAHKTTLVFVNTRMQAELLFQELWRINDDNLPIALHHGSLDVAQRRRVEAAMADGVLKAVVCTSSLDLGIDWGDVDLVVNVGAPKGSSRLMQRIGRANHRLDEPSAGGAGAGQPLRGAGVPRRHGGGAQWRAGFRRHPLRRARRAGPARARHGLRRAVRGARTLQRGRHRRALCRSRLGDLRAGGRFRRHRRLCAARL